MALVVDCESLWDWSVFQFPRKSMYSNSAKTILPIFAIARDCDLPVPVRSS
jgi:hypothetical protein